jgi:MFS superfamily sulfate permease-like transporter
MAAIAGVLSAGVLAGVMIGIFLSLIWLIRESTHPAIFELGNQPGTRLYRDLEGNPHDVTHPGLLILRFDAGLFFANADALSDRLQAIVLSRDPPVRSVILSCEGINFIDAQGAEKLKELTEVVTQSGLTLSLSRCKPEVRDVLEKDGFIELLRSDRMFATTPDAVAAALEQIRPPHGGSDRR